MTVEARELGAKVEPLGLRAEAESGPRKLEVEVRDTPAPATLEDGRPTGLAPYRWGAEGERGGCQMTAVEEAGVGGRAGISEERALEDIFEERALECTFEERALENLKPPQGWTGPAGTTERGEGAFRTPAQSPSHSNPPPCPAVPDEESAHPQPWCRGRSSTPRSHRPRLAPSWWALSPALAPGLTGWAQLPG